MQRIQALPIISTDDFLSFLDTTGRSFSFEVYSLVIHSQPEGAHKLYRLDYSGRTLEETRQILTLRLK
jgi:hypothetical protein